MSLSEFWKARQAEFEKYSQKYSELEAHWHGAAANWLLWWGKTPEGLNVPQECRDILDAIARKASTELPIANPGATGRNPWSMWLGFMRGRNWGFHVTGHAACTEPEWDAGVRDGKSLIAVRKEQRYATGDEWKKVYRRTKNGGLRRLSARDLEGKSREDLQKYYHWLESGTIEQVFASSARLCESLAARSFEWEAIREEFERLPAADYSLIWTAQPPVGVSADQLTSQWTWYRPTDLDLRGRATAILQKAATSRGYDSEDGWLAELRAAKFVDFELSGTEYIQLRDGTHTEVKSGVLRSVERHSITLCCALERNVVNHHASVTGGRAKESALDLSRLVDAGVGRTQQQPSPKTREDQASQPQPANGRHHPTATDPRATANRGKRGLGSSAPGPAVHAGMITVPAGAQIWITAGVTDLRRGFTGLSAIVQTKLEQDPFGGHIFVFRGRRGDLIKVRWWDGDGLCLFAKRLERGRFVWPKAENGTVALTRAQLSMLLEGIDWRRPIRTSAPSVAV